MTNDPMIRDVVNDYEIPFVLMSRQSRLPNLCQLTKEVSDLGDQEAQDMLRKGAIAVSDPKESQFLSSLFLVKLKDGGNHPVVKLKYLNRNIPYQHFKMEGLFLLKEMLLPRDKMVQDRPEGCILCNPSLSEIQEGSQIPVERSSNELYCICFRLSQDFLISTKLLKVSISLLRKLNM